MTALKYIPNYNLADYQRWEGDWELWDGIPVSMSPSPFGSHQWMATRLATSINRQFDEQGCDDCFVFMEVDWIVNDNTVVRPDVSVCCGAFPEKFIESAPSLVIEVLSESTAEKDRTSKRALYEAEGVAAYLVVDPASDRFEFHRRDGQKFEPPKDVKQAKLALHPGCDLVLDLPRLPS